MMLLYHGSDMEVISPRIISSEVGRDFGFGFYTTDIKEQAIRWARRKQRISKRNGRLDAKAFVSVFEFDEKCSKNQLVRYFGDEPELDWLELVCECRSHPEYSHGYDIVAGKIANDSVGETVSFVVAGVMRKEDALERLKFEQINNQICFCTEKSLQCIEYLRTEQV